MQALEKQGLLKGAKTYKLEFYEQCIIGKKTKVKFSTVIHRIEGILDYVHTEFGDLPRLQHLKVITTLCCSLMIILGVVGCTLCDRRMKS